MLVPSITTAWVHAVMRLVVKFLRAYLKLECRAFEEFLSVVA